LSLPVITTWAPGRVNLIGEHTDYNGGLVLPAAIQLGISVEVHRLAPDVRLESDVFGSGAPFVPDGSGDPVGGWARLGQALASELAALGRRPIGIEATVHSTLPAGVGLSSSAALEVALGLAFCAAAELRLDRLVLAAACRRAEEQAVGVPCGILDQAASLLGEENAATLIDCTTLDHRLVPLPHDALFLIIPSGIERRLEHTGYAERRRELEAALAAVGATSSQDVRTADIVGLEPTLRRRLRHVVTENARVLQFVEALAANDLPASGELMTASHASLRDDYEVSLPAVDELVEMTLDAGALGARLLGGGFGGAVLALVAAANAEAVTSELAALRDAPRPIIVRASRGAHSSASNQ
jgi:galactokinase